MWLLPVGNAFGLPRVTGAEPVLPNGFDEIDNFAHTHALRDGKPFASTSPTQQCDVVVVGGGIAGLTAAYRLRDRKVIVLEKENEPGGNSRMRELNGCRYSLGAFLSQGPIAPFTEFFNEIGAEFIPVSGKRHALWTGGKMVHDPFGAGLNTLPWSAADKQALQKALDRLRPMLDPQRGISFPRERNTPEMRAFDNLTLWADFDRQGLPRRVRELFDIMISARIGDNGENLSAWYGNYLLSNLLAPEFTMRGGHGDFTRRLVTKLDERPTHALHTGFTVLRVENRGADEVWVSGIDAAGLPQTIAARCAVMATPKHFARHVVPGLAAERGQDIAAFRYNAYMVAQVFLKKPSGLPFETALPKARHARFVVAPDSLAGNSRSDGGGLLTVYLPFPRIAGRAQLLSADAARLGQGVLDDLVQMQPALATQIERVVLHRWGHPMLTATPGMGAQLAAARQPHGRIVFGHSDNLGITGLYSAVWAGMEAEADAEIVLS